MFRIIKPDNGYCLYFPKRSEGERVVIGQTTWVWLWSSWKHIRLGQFQVNLPAPNDPELVTTIEGLEVKVKADFKIVIGGPSPGREERLKLATESSSPVRSIKKKKLEHTFFRDWASNYCKNSIKRVLGECSFVDLIRMDEDTEYQTDTDILESPQPNLDKQDVDEEHRPEADESRVYREGANGNANYQAIVRRIIADLEKNLEKIGLILVESTIIIEPIEPPRTSPKEIIDAWFATQLARQKAENEASIAKLETDHERMEKEQQLEYQRKIHELERASDFRENERQEEIKERERTRNKENKLRKIEEEMDGWIQEAQLRKIRMEAQIKEEEENERERLENIKRKNEEQDIQYRLQMKERELKHELAMLELKEATSQKDLEVAKLRKEAEKLETEIARAKGELNAAIIEQETLARAADIIKMREIFLQALPKIMEEANRPIEKMGEIRMNLIGPSGDIERNDLLKGLLGSASVLPLVKEAIRFLKDFEYESRDMEKGIEALQTNNENEKEQ